MESRKPVLETGNGIILTGNGIIFPAYLLLKTKRFYNIFFIQPGE